MNVGAGLHRATFEAFLQPHVEPLQPHVRTRRPGELNLKSCELAHSAMDTIVRDELAKLHPEAVARYPVEEEAVAAVAAHRRTSPDRILLSAGSDAAVALIVDALARTTGRLVLQAPNYDAWWHYASLRRVACEEVRLRAGATKFEVDDVLAVLDRTPPAVVALSNPNGPTGLVLDAEEVLGVTAACERGGHVLVVDECYVHFDGRPHFGAASPNVLCVESFSKAFGMAGARLACMEGDPRLLAHLARWRPSSTVSATALALGRGLLQREEEVASIWRDVAATRAWFAEELRARGWETLPSGGNFVTCRIGADGHAAAVVSGLSAHGVRIRDLSPLPGLAGCIRFAMAERHLLVGVLDVLDRVAS